jgi:hypothetical protein
LTVVKAAALLLVVLGVGYALLYVGWLRRSRQGAHDGDTLTGAGDSAEQPASQIAGAEPTTTASGVSRALTLAWAEGTYIGTTIAISRHERVAALGLGERARASMVVDDSTVRWEREGIGFVRVAGPRLRVASLERARAGTHLGQAQVVLVSWTADNGDRYDTRFLPRTRADSASLVAAVHRLMEFGPSLDNSPLTPDGTL